ncbi:MAG: hypothetical protein JWP07_3158 [Pseudonocardiales bacterium]|nr:hypothetical protein [Pseudonocardiales bacterium]
MTELATSPDLQRVIDHIAVRDVVLKYARAIDRMDWELLRSCYYRMRSTTTVRSAGRSRR